LSITDLIIGLCKSGFRDEMGPIVAAIINWLSWSSEKGARNFLYATVKDTTPGSFISHCEEKPVSTFVASPKGRETQAKYWSEAVAIWRKIAPEVDEVLQG
jgi:retinol dehydrogenase-12